MTARLSDREVYAALREHLVERGPSEVTRADPAEIAAVLRRSEPADGLSTTAKALTLHEAWCGYGPLHAVVLRPGLTDVVVNGPDETWVEAGSGLERVDVAWRDEAQVREFAASLASRCGRRLDDARPFVDATLPDGVRLHAVIPPVAVGNTLVSLRFPPSRTWTVEELLTAGSMTAGEADFLVAAVRSRRNIVVSGSTGSGKTTLASALLSEVGATERVLLVEDTPELKPLGAHVVRLTTRHANAEGAGEVTLRNALRQALRMRPDRLVVGEVRGPEIQDVLLALNTGHAGMVTTLHANSVEDVPSRVVALGATAGMTADAAMAQFLPAVDVVVHMERTASGRRIAAIGETCDQAPFVRRVTDAAASPQEASR